MHRTSLQLHKGEGGRFGERPNVQCCYYGLEAHSRAHRRGLTFQIPCLLFVTCPLANLVSAEGRRFEKANKTSTTGEVHGSSLTPGHVLEKVPTIRWLRELCQLSLRAGHDPRLSSKEVVSVRPP